MGRRTRLPRRAHAASTELIHQGWLGTPEHASPVRRGSNSSSSGIHPIANGLKLQPGDEVVVATNDFPSDVLPWLRLAIEGVVIKQVRPADQVLSPDEVTAALTPRTNGVCLTWVHSFSGRVIDLDGIGELCRSADALFVVNGAQGVGGIPIAVNDHPIDALTGVGFKYLCGPYGTGFCWLGPRSAERVSASKMYWLAALTADDLAAPELDLDSVKMPDTAAKHDMRANRQLRRIR
jgi:cysteine desulfurase / selenocysteine lyase